MATRKGPRLNPCPPFWAASLREARAGKVQVWCVRVGWIGIWDFEGFFFVFFFLLSLLSFLHYFLSFIQHGYYYLRVKKKKSHGTFLRVLLRGWNMRQEIWKGGEKKTNLLSAYLLLSPAHLVLIKHQKHSWRWREMNPVCLGLTITLWNVKKWNFLFF